MNRLDKALAIIAPRLAMNRILARTALARVTMDYDAASRGRRTSGLRDSRLDADASAGFGRRSRIAAVARDMARNNPFAVRAQQSISANVVGPGIIPKVGHAKQTVRDAGLAIVKAHLDTVAIDAHGRQNLYGLQNLACATMVRDGEVLIVRRDPDLRDNLTVPLQIEVLEVDFLDSLKDGRLPGGGHITEGIEYDARGRRVGYWLYDEHPGTMSRSGVFSLTSRFVPASSVIHLFRQDRAGQQRGVSWFAPVVLALTDLAEFQDAQVLRQKVAATFAAFVRRGDHAPTPEDSTARMLPATLSPGAVYELDAGEEVDFASPPGVGDFDSFVASILRSVAGALGITYEAISGDLRQTNFSSARMGRVEMDRNVAMWQWQLMIPQFLGPFSEWLRAAWITAQPAMVLDIKAAQFDWTPPQRTIVDPTREFDAMAKAVRAGFIPWQAAVRGLGDDPETVLAQHVEDHAAFDKMGLVFDSDPRRVSGAGVPHASPDDGRDIETDTTEEQEA